VGGRLQFFHEAWQEMGADRFVVEVLREGYRINFRTTPTLSVVPCIPSDSLNPLKDAHIQEQIDILLQKQAIEVVPGPHWGPGFYSRLFTVPKPNGKVRPIIDLKLLNKKIRIPKFKMESLQTVWSSLNPGNWAFSLDLSDAYFHVPIHPESRKFLRLFHRGTVYQFKALPFGLSTAPWIFTRVVSEVKMMVHLQGIFLLCYLDDWLVQVISYHLGLVQARYLTDLCASLGLLVNWEKSELTPSQSFSYIGAHWDLTSSKVFPLDKNLVKMKSLVSLFLSSPAQSARMWQSLIGTLTSLYRFFQFGRLHTRPIQWHLLTSWNQRSGHPLQMIDIPQFLLPFLQWWLDRSILPAGVDLLPTKFNYHLFTDASLIGWGGHANGVNTAGLWSQEERTLYINVLELRAVINSLLALVPPKGAKILVATDNTTVVAHINKQGGTHSRSLMVETYDLYSLVMENDWVIQARYIPGQLNCIADQLSRTGQPLPSEWSLNPRALERLFKAWHRPQIDLFATRFNNKLPVFVSPSPDDLAIAVDALSFNMNGLDVYAFPPREIMSQFLQRFQMSRGCRAIVVAPKWPKQPWYPLLTQLAVVPPIKLPCWETLLSQPLSGKLHPFPEILNLHGWLLMSKR